MSTLWIVIAAVFDFGDGFAALLSALLFSDGEGIGFPFRYGQLRGCSRNDRLLAVGASVYDDSCFGGGGWLCPVYGFGDTGLFRVAPCQIQYR